MVLLKRTRLSLNSYNRLLEGVKRRPGLQQKLLEAAWLHWPKAVAELISGGVELSDLSRTQTMALERLR